MSQREWPADAYAIGSYIQATVADAYLANLKIRPTDTVLDVGCGNGTFTRKILDKVPQGSVLGIDASDSMLQLAQEVIHDYPNFSIKNADVHTLEYNAQFDYLVSFWCLQWAHDIHKAFSNMMHALKPGGRIFTLFPAGDDPYIMGYYALKKSGQFDSLKQFTPPVDYTRFTNLAETLKSIPCKNLKVTLSRQSITLPSLDVFRKFVNGIAFYQGQVSDAEVTAINEALVDYFDAECKKNYNGEYQFNFTVYLVSGEK